MSVRQQVEDAAFLAEHGRHLGALTNLMLAVAASSRKTFPKGTKSLERPTETMSDREAFSSFLGGRIRRLLFGSYGSPEFGNSGICVSFRGKQYDIAHILYKFYRCELVHEGELPQDVEFTAPSNAHGLAANQHRLGVSISAGEKMVLDHGWIDLLIRAVVQARCNGGDFGIEHFDLIPSGTATEAEIEANVIAKYEITPGRFQILREVVRLMSPKSVQGSDDSSLAVQFSNLLQAGQISGGAVTGLASRGFATYEGSLLPKGISALRELSASYTLVPAP